MEVQESPLNSELLPDTPERTCASGTLANAFILHLPGTEPTPFIFMQLIINDVHLLMVLKAFKMVENSQVKDATKLHLTL